MHTGNLRAGRSGDRIPVKARFYTPVQTDPEAYLASYTMGTGFSLWAKWPGHEVDHPPPSSSEIKERVELFLYSPSGPSWPVLGWPWPLFYLCPQDTLCCSSREVGVGRICKATCCSVLPVESARVFQISWRLLWWCVRNRHISCLWFLPGQNQFCGVWLPLITNSLSLSVAKSWESRHNTMHVGYKKTSCPVQHFYWNHMAEYSLINILIH